MGRAAPAGQWHSRQGKRLLGVRETRSPLEPESPTRFPYTKPALQPVPGTFHGLSSVVHDQEADGNRLECQEQRFTPRAADSRGGREEGRPGKRQGSLHGPSSSALGRVCHTHRAWLMQRMLAPSPYSLIRTADTGAGEDLSR